MLADLGRSLERSPLFFLETDHAAVARMALLERPDLGVMRRQFDRAVDILKRAERALSPAGTEERVSA